MTKKRRMFDIDLPEDAGAAPAETFPAGKVGPKPERSSSASASWPMKLVVESYSQ